MLTKRVLYLLLALLCVSCSNNSFQVKQLVEMAGEELHLSSDLSFYKLVFASDSLLILQPYSSKYKLSAFRKAEGCFVEESFMNIGKGPMEVIDACFKYSNDTLYALSNTPSSIQGVISMPIDSVTNVSKWKYVPIDECILWGGDFAPLTRNEIVMLAGAVDSKELLSTYDLVKHSLASMVFWPKDNFKGSSITKQMMYFRSSSLYAKGNKLLYASGEGRYATIIDVDTVPPSEINLYSEPPKYKVAQDGMNPKRDSNGSLGMYAFASDRYIYLSLIQARINSSGKYVPSDYKGYPPYYTDEMDVFDWDGNYVRTLVFDYPFAGFFVNEKEDCIYTHSCNPSTMTSVVHKYYE